MGRVGSRSFSQHLACRKDHALLPNTELRYYDSNVFRLPADKKQVKTGMQSTPAYNRTFWDFMCDGMPRNALKENSDGAGGYLVPDEYELKLVSALENENHLRRISNVIQTRHRLIIPTVIGHCAAAWIEEGEQITETEPSFGQIVLDASKVNFGNLSKILSLISSI